LDVPSGFLPANKNGYHRRRPEVVRFSPAGTSKPPGTCMLPGVSPAPWPVFPSFPLLIPKTVA